MRNALILGLLAVAQAGSAQSPADSSFAGLDAYVRSELARLHVPGAAIAIVRGDSLVHALVLGRADESGRAVTLETPFMIGSLSKSITALAVLQLVDAGRAALDSPVTQYLPWFRPGGTREADAAVRVTIRHLLNQSSGIRSAAGRMDWAYPDTTDAALERHARGLAMVKLAHSPGTTFEYANANYVLLGELIQEVSHTSFERYIQEHVFDPLAMRRSFASEPAARRNGMALGYQLWFGRPRAAASVPFIRANLPAGQLIASAADMARYVSLHLANGQHAGGTLVSAEAMSELHTPVSRLNEHWSYAMGWMSGTVGGQTVLWHNGLLPNFYAFMALMPARHEGIVMLTNLGNVLELPRLNRAALGALTQLVGGAAGPDQSLCAMCPVSPLTSEKTVRALRPVAAALVLLQCCWMVWSVKRRRWRSRRGAIRSVSLALVWAGLVLFAFPLLAQMPPSVMSDVMPDLWAVIDASVILALGWAIVRIVVQSDRFGRFTVASHAPSSRSPS